MTVPKLCSSRSNFNKRLQTEPKIAEKKFLNQQVEFTYFLFSSKFGLRIRRPPVRVGPGAPINSFEYAFQMCGFKLSILKAFSLCLSISPQRKHSHKSSPSRNILAWHFEHIATSRSTNTTGSTVVFGRFAGLPDLSLFVFMLCRSLRFSARQGPAMFFPASGLFCLPVIAVIGIIILVIIIPVPARTDAV
jgi:hypothetical protein